MSYTPVQAQSLPSTSVQMIVTPHNQTIDYRDRTLCFDIPANVEYTTSSDASWLTVRQGSDGTVYLHADMNEDYSNRTANVTFTSTKDANLKKTLTITQGSCNAAEMLTDRSRIYPSSASDNTHQSGEDISKTYDNNTSTLFHSQYSPNIFKVSETNPAVLTYNFEDVNSISSITYVPRTDGTNGNFGQVKVSYKLKGDTDYKELGEYNFGFKTSSSTIHLENNPLINPESIKFEVMSGSGDYASCAEMEFRDNTQSLEAQFNMFADDICSTLRPDVDAATIDTIPNPFIKMLAKNIYENTYNTNYRIAEYPCHLSPTTQSEQWNAPGKLYDQLSGVTGISFKAHTTQAVAVSGIPEGMNVQLKVVAWYVGRVGQNFDGGNPNTSTYTLFNGVNIINYDYDVLLSTTIVENGIDISNANTIIINDAHRFGLSDLHQMRGRVGRGNRKAFCYLLAPPLSALTQEARRRLEALETFSELGSGFNLSMQDLDIRGAGNLLGAEQSGFMEDLGYETYQKILNQAVTELKNDEFGEMYEEDIAHGRDIKGDEFVEDCAIESDLEMYLPDQYVPSSSERMLLYRELDNIGDDAGLQRYRAELEDRFGPVPREGLELMQVVPLRRFGKSLGCEKIILRQGQMRMQFVANPMSAYYKSKAFDSVLNYIGRNPRRCNLKEVAGKRMMIVSGVSSVEDAVSVLRGILEN